MSIALNASEVQVFQKGGTTTETDNTAVVAAVAVTWDTPAGTLFRVTVPYGQMSGATFQQGAQAVASVLSINLTTGAITDQFGNSFGTVTGTVLAAIQAQLLAVRNNIETWLAANNVIQGTFTAWTTL